MQKLSNWILAERPDVIVELPRLLVGEDTLVSAMVLRAWTGIEVARQFEWETAKQAFDDWRLVFETRGVLVMQMQLGAELRGFALHDQLAPLIAVNTGENYQARSFTLFHELCHLSLGETSACSNAIPRGSTEFNVERWCEEVAGNALIPRTALEVVAAEIKHRGVGEIELIRGVANRFKVSLRAAAIALIRLGAIAPSVYDEVAQQARISDREKGFARGRGQKAPERRRSELGVRTLSLVFDAMKANALSERDARDYLRLDGTEIDELASQFAV
jgi:Zn-dependent peptidase ImmA (M78 family)